MKYLIIILILILILSILLHGSVIAQDFFIIDSASGIEITRLYSYAPTTNYSVDASFGLGDDFLPQNRDSRIIIRWPMLGDSMIAIDGIETVASWDSALVGFYVSYVGLFAGDDSLIVHVHKITQPAWVIDETTWDNYITSTAWTVAGGDFGATIENLPGWGDPGLGDSIVLGAGTGTMTYPEVAVGDTIWFPISSVTITDTIGGGLIVIARPVDDDGSDDCTITFYGTGAGNEERWPILKVYYTLDSGEPSDLSGRRRRGTILLN